MNADRTADIATIHQFVAAVEASQRRRSPDDFIALFLPDAVWVTGGGIRLTGRDEIDNFTRRVLTPALGDVHATYRVEHALFVDENVAAVNVRATPVHGDGTRIEDEPEGTKLYVLKRTAEGWKFASSHNGFIQPQ